MTYADVKRNRCEIRKKKREERIERETRCKQKIIGVLMIFISILSIILSNGDVTFAAFFSPMGIYACATKRIM